MPKMKAVRDTSIISYRELCAGRLGKLQRQVFRIIKQFPGSTDREIIDISGVEGNSIRPRRYELLKKGLIEEAGKRICTVTGKLAWTWKPASDLEEPLFEQIDAITLHQQYPIPKKDFIWLCKVMRARGYEYVRAFLWKKRGGIL